MAMSLPQAPSKHTTSPTDRRAKRTRQEAFPEGILWPKRNCPAVSIVQPTNSHSKQPCIFNQSVDDSSSAPTRDISPPIILTTPVSVPLIVVILPLLRNL